MSTSVQPLRNYLQTLEKFIIRHDAFEAAVRKEVQARKSSSGCSPLLSEYEQFIDQLREQRQGALVVGVNIGKRTYQEMASVLEDCLLKCCAHRNRVERLVQDAVTCGDIEAEEMFCTFVDFCCSIVANLRFLGDTIALGEHATVQGRPALTGRVRLTADWKEGATVDGIAKSLTYTQWVIVKELVTAGETGLNKDNLEAINTGARQILKTLRKDSVWENAIQMAGVKGGRYRINS